VATNPLLGGAEAESFGVGVGREGPTPALPATPPKRGFPRRRLFGYGYEYDDEDDVRSSGSDISHLTATLELPR